MNKHKDYYPEITERIKKAKEWIKESDDYIERGNKYIEEYELQRRQNNETDDN